MALVLGTVVSTAAADETTDQAVWLLQKSTLVHRNGFHNVLLRALRQMKDPSLEPLFGELVQRRHPGLRIHGILGLGEISDPPRLDLAMVADIPDAGTQAQLVSAALDSDLLSKEDAEQLTRWPGLDPAVRVLVAGKLIADGEALDPAILEEAKASDNVALWGMAALLRLQVGDETARADLERLSRSNSPRRDNVRALVLQTAIKYEFAVVSDWAVSIASEPGVDRTLRYQAMRAALKYGDEGAVALWERQMSGSDNEADRIRMAMLALDVADRLDARVFEVLAGDEVPLIDLVGRVGRSIASGRVDRAAVDELIGMNNILASRWALMYARGIAADDGETAGVVLMSIIRAADDEATRFKATRMENAVLASEILHAEVPGGGAVLRGAFADASEMLKEALLMGLIRSDGDRPDWVVKGMVFEGRTAEAMALLLRCKHADEMTEQEVASLALVVRGGAGLQEPLRIQAAWTYLKKTHQDRVALARVLGEQPDLR